MVRDVAANNIWICVHLCMFTFSMLYEMLATTHQVLNTLVTTSYLACSIPVPTSGNKRVVMSSLSQTDGVLRVVFVCLALSVRFGW